MSNEDFVVSIGADSTAFFAELKNLKKGIAKELNDGNLSVQFREAMLGDLGRIAQKAGQIKWDSVGTSLYKSLSTAIDDAFSPRKNTLTVTPARNADTGRFQKQTTDVALGDKEQQAAIVESMRKRYAREDQMRQANIDGERNAAQQIIDVNRNQQRAIVQSMEMRFKAEDEAAGKRAEAQKAIQEEINTYPRMRYAMYDVANAANTLSQATLGVAAAAVTAFSQYESAFTAVERTVGSDATANQVANLRKELVDLATQIPLSFGQITEIASLGAQLGVATQDIAGFTDTVAKFSATTNVSTTAAAQSFGALGELLNISAQDYDRLGSAIAYAGVNAVATETEILSVTTAIAGVSANAGLSTQYVLGLATSLASLRVPAEQSRGAMTRVFQEISRSAQQGGPALDEFARVIGTTRDEAKALAETDMETFFNKFLNGLSGMDASQLTQSLDNMNLSDIRVTNTLARLSDNMDVVNKSMADVGSSYAAGTQLNDAFAKVSDDLASKLTILNNAFMELQATAGAPLAAALKPALDFLTQFITHLSELGKTGVGQVILGITGTVMVLVGGLAAIASAAAIGFGGFLALRTAWNGANMEGLKLNSTLVQTISWLLKMPGATKPAELSMRGLGSAMAGTAASSKALSMSMKAAGWIGIILTGIELISAGWDAFQKTQMSAAEKNAEIASAYFGSASGGLAEAFAKDMKSGAEAIQQIDTEVISAQSSAKGYVTDIQSVMGAQVALSAATSDTTKIIEKQSIAYGENAQKALASMLANNEAFQNLFKAGGGLQVTGADPQAFAKSILGDPQEGGKKYIDGLIQSMSSEAGAMSGNVKAIFEQFAAARDAGFIGGATADIAATELATALGISFEEAKKLADGLYQMQLAAEGAAAEVEVGAVAADAAAAANGALATSEEDLAASLQATREEYNKYTDDLFAGVNARQDTMDAMSAFGTVLGEEGDAAAVAGGTLQATMAALIAEDPTVAAAKMQYLLEYLIANVPTATGTIAYLTNEIAKLSGGKGVSPKAFDISGFTKNLKAAGNAAGSAAAKVRTLKDYASDLAKVFDRAFDIRFSSMSALDKITAGFQSIKEETDNANQEIKDLNATIDSLTADKSLKQYFLSVAEAYGDTVKAAQLRAEIAKIDSDLTDNQNQLSDAQAASNKTLIGNSSAAIKNRKTITGLVKDYQDYIQTLASSGASQETLAAATAAAKNDFMAQATQLGYNSNELGMYAAAFDDVQVAIGNIDRGITVDASMDPALQALNEFEAQAAASGARAGKNYASAFEDETSTIDPVPNKEELSRKASEFWTAATFGSGNAINAFGPLKDGYKSIPTTIDAQKQPTKTALDGLFGPSNTATTFDKFKTDVSSTAASIPGSITLQKGPTSTALDSVVGPTNTDTHTNNFKTNFGRMAESIPTKITEQAPAVAGSLSIISSKGGPAGSDLSTKFGNGVSTLPSTVDAQDWNTRQSFRQLGTESASGYSSGLDVFGWIGKLFKNLLGYKDGGLVGYATGGYVSGAGGPRSDSIPAMLSNGEYVMNAAAVGKYGVGMLDQLNQMRAPKYFAGGGAVGISSPSAGVVSLSPEDRALLRNIGGSGEVVLYANNEAIARSANAGNKQIVAAGGRP